MPTYAYVCTACAHRFEIVQAISDSSLTTCPECGSALRKVFHPVGVAFKGSGFYRTDSRAKQTSESSGTGSETGTKESAPKKEGATATSGGSDSASSSNAKPATKSEKSAPSGGAAKPAS